MKKLLKSKICGSVNSARDPRMIENWLKSQTFPQKKKKKTKTATQTHLGSANALPKRTLRSVWIGLILLKLKTYC